MGKLIIAGNPYAIDKIVVNNTEYPRHEPKFHIFFDNIECHAGDNVKIYHDSERQWTLHSDNEEKDLVQIHKNTRITGTLLASSEYISFIVPENNEDAVLEIISNQGDNDVGFDNIYATWSTGWAKQLIEAKIQEVSYETQVVHYSKDELKSIAEEVGLTENEFEQYCEMLNTVKLSDKVVEENEEEVELE